MVNAEKANYKNDSRGFFSGSGTTAKVASNLNRQFIACDIGINAVQKTRDRLAKLGASFNILKIKSFLKKGIRVC
ncbi:MAG: hypothetical protein JRJ49_07090 [Deltaproteobacteria bacterium]|nr:hypothetical protein [Deltaproteobacteria bacterium]